MFGSVVAAWQREVRRADLTLRYEDWAWAFRLIIVAYQLFAGNGDLGPIAALRCRVGLRRARAPRALTVRYLGSSGIS